MATVHLRTSHLHVIYVEVARVKVERQIPERGLKVAFAILVQGTSPFGIFHCPPSTTLIYKGVRTLKSVRVLIVLSNA